MLMRLAVLLLAVLLTPVAARAADIYYIQEDFDEEAGYFFEGKIGDTSFTRYPGDGYYEIDAMKSETGSLAALTVAFENYTASVDMQF